jgi:hypothetical protein
MERLEACVWGADKSTLSNSNVGTLKSDCFRNKTKQELNITSVY